MGKRFVFPVALLAIGAVVAVGVWAADPPPPGPDQPFAGHVILVHLKQANGMPVIMEQPRLKRLGDRWFLVGKSATIGLGGGGLGGGPGLGGGTGAAPGATWCPVDEIARFEEYATRAELNKAIRDGTATIP